MFLSLCLLSFFTTFLSHNSHPPHNKCTGYYFARIILMALWMLHGGVQGVRNVVHPGVETSTLYGEIFRRTCAENVDGIIDLGRGRTIRSSSYSGVSQPFWYPCPRFLCDFFFYYRQNSDFAHFGIVQNLKTFSNDNFSYDLPFQT